MEVTEAELRMSKWKRTLSDVKEEQPTRPLVKKVEPTPTVDSVMQRMTKVKWEAIRDPPLFHPGFEPEPNGVKHRYSAPYPMMHEVLLRTFEVCDMAADFDTDKWVWSVSAFYMAGYTAVRMFMFKHGHVWVSLIGGEASIFQKINDMLGRCFSTGRAPTEFSEVEVAPLVPECVESVATLVDRIPTEIFTKDELQLLATTRAVLYAVSATPSFKGVLGADRALIVGLIRAMTTDDFSLDAVICAAMSLSALLGDSVGASGSGSSVVVTQSLEPGDGVEARRIFGRLANKTTGKTALVMVSDYVLQLLDEDERESIGMVSFRRYCVEILANMVYFNTDPKTHEKIGLCREVLHQVFQRALKNRVQYLGLKVAGERGRLALMQKYPWEPRPESPLYYDADHWLREYMSRWT